MNKYFLIRRLRWPAVLMLIGVVALLYQAGAISNFWHLFIPLLLILLGVLMLAERAVLAADGGFPPYPGTPYSPGAIDPATGQPWTDKNNIDPSLRSRPLLGLPVLIGMQPMGYGKWSGHLYNVDDGKTYQGNIIELNATTIKVEGCVLIICGGENLSRLK